MRPPSRVCLGYIAQLPCIMMRTKEVGEEAASGSVMEEVRDEAKAMATSENKRNRDGLRREKAKEAGSSNGLNRMKVAKKVAKDNGRRNGPNRLLGQRFANSSWKGFAVSVPNARTYTKSAAIHLVVAVPVVVVVVVVH